MTRTYHVLSALLLSCALVACEAGPSVFDRSAAPGPEDTADAASLPAIPSAAEVEAGATGAVDDPSSEGSGDVDPIGAPFPDSAPGGTSAPGSAVAGDPDGSVDSTAVGPPVFPRPEHVRGLYLNAWASGSTRRVDALLEVARRTEINTFVIDIKDATGYVSHRTSVPMSQEIGATGEIRIRDLPGLLRRLHAEGIYPVARIVIVKDPLLAAAHPDLAAQSRDGGVFKDGKGIVWLNPYDRRVWEYHVALAREVADMGFPEIQWDYVRFPDIPASEKAKVVYPGAGDVPQPDAIRNFLAYSREELGKQGVVVTADVFGITTSASRDVGIGQVWESFIGAVDVALPMVYPSHYWKGSFGLDEPNAYPYEVVRQALEDALERSATVEGAGTTRPWLQDFTLGKPPYDVAEVRAQIQATYDAGIQEWVLWNPGTRYTEGALEPVGGFPVEPMIRIGGRLAPVSQRLAVLDSVASAKAPKADPASATGSSAADSVGGSRVPDGRH